MQAERDLFESTPTQPIDFVNTGSADNEYVICDLIEEARNPLWSDDNNSVHEFGGGNSLDIVTTHESSKTQKEPPKIMVVKNDENQKSGVMKNRSSEKMAAKNDNNQKSHVKKNRSSEKMTILQFINKYKYFRKIKEKPTFSFTALITMAITSTSDGYLTVARIKKFISDNFPYYRVTSGWEESVHRCLKEGKFQLVECNCTLQSKGSITNCYMNDEDSWSVDRYNAALILQQAFSINNTRKRKLTFPEAKKRKIARLSGNHVQDISGQTNSNKVEDNHVSDEVITQTDMQISIDSQIPCEENAHLEKLCEKLFEVSRSLTTGKPPFNLSILVVVALISSTKDSLSVTEIVEIISQLFPYYKNFNFYGYVWNELNKNSKLFTKNYVTPFQNYKWSLKMDVTSAKNMLEAALLLAQNCIAMNKSIFTPPNDKKVSSAKISGFSFNEDGQGYSEEAESLDKTMTKDFSDTSYINEELSPKENEKLEILCKEPTINITGLSVNEDKQEVELLDDSPMKTNTEDVSQSSNTNQRYLRGIEQLKVLCKKLTSAPACLSTTSKPPFSYPLLITFALISSNEYELTSHQIVTIIGQMFPYYQQTVGKSNLKRAVSSVLHLHKKYFLKIKNNLTKTSMWSLKLDVASTINLLEDLLSHSNLENWMSHKMTMPINKEKSNNKLNDQSHTTASLTEKETSMKEKIHEWMWETCNLNPSIHDSPLEEISKRLLRNICKSSNAFHPLSVVISIAITLSPRGSLSVPGIFSFIDTFFPHKRYWKQKVRSVLNTRDFVQVGRRLNIWTIRPRASARVMAYERHLNNPISKSVSDPTPSYNMTKVETVMIESDEEELNKPDTLEMMPPSPITSGQMLTSQNPISRSVSDPTPSYNMTKVETVMIESDEEGLNKPDTLEMMPPSPITSRQMLTSQKSISTSDSDPTSSYNMKEEDIVKIESDEEELNKTDTSEMMLPSPLVLGEELTCQKSISTSDSDPMSSYNMKEEDIVKIESDEEELNKTDSSEMMLPSPLVLGEELTSQKNFINTAGDKKLFSSFIKLERVDEIEQLALEHRNRRRLNHMESDDFIGFDLDYWSGVYWRGWGKQSTRRFQCLSEIVENLKDNIDLDSVLKDCEEAVSIEVEVIEMLENKKVKPSTLTSSGVVTEDLTNAIEQHVKALMVTLKSTSVEPPFSYPALITMALVSTMEHNSISLNDILQFIQDKFLYYRSCDKSWENTIHKILNWSDFFIKAGHGSCVKKKTDDHKCCWRVDLLTAYNILQRALEAEQNKVTKKGLKQDQTEQSVRYLSTHKDHLQNDDPKKYNNKADCYYLNPTENSSHNPICVGAALNHKKTIQQREDFKENCKNCQVDSDVLSKEATKIDNSQKLHLHSNSNDKENCRINDSLDIQGGYSALSPKLNIEGTGAKKCDSSEKSAAKCNLNNPKHRKLVNNENDLSTGQLDVVCKQYKYCCTICNKKFHCLFVSKHHKYTHLEENSYPCYLCHKSFYSEHDLNVHIKKNHSGKNSHVISSLCNKYAMNRVINMRRNNRKSITLKHYFGCPECFQVFTSNLYLNLHMSSCHIGRYQYECNHCIPADYFYSEENLFLHIQVNHPNVYVCSVCSAFFGDKKLFDSHTTFVHC